MTALNLDGTFRKFRIDNGLNTAANHLLRVFQAYNL